MAAQHRKIEALARRLAKEGWRSRYAAGHVVFYPPDKTKPLVVIGTTTSGWKAVSVMMAKFRAAGAEVKATELQ